MAADDPEEYVEYFLLASLDDHFDSPVPVEWLSQEGVEALRELKMPWWMNWCSIVYRLDRACEVDGFDDRFAGGEA